VIKRSRVRSPAGAKNECKFVKCLPLLSCVLCYIMCLIVVSVCTIVNLRKPCAAVWQRVYYCAKLRMLCYVQSINQSFICSESQISIAQYNNKNKNSEQDTPQAHGDFSYITCTVLRGSYCVIQHSCCNTNKHHYLFYNSVD